jgi:hypothetical protein
MIVERKMTLNSANSTENIAASTNTLLEANPVSNTLGLHPFVVIVYIIQFLFLFLFLWLCGGPRRLNPLFLPVHTRSGAPPCEACRAKSFVSNQYGSGVTKVYNVNSLSYSLIIYIYIYIDSVSGKQ